MGNRDIESLSANYGMAQLIAAKTNLLRIYGPGRISGELLEEGRKVQEEINRTGTCSRLETVLTPLGKLVTNLPGSLTEEEIEEVHLLAGALEGYVGTCLLPVVLTWVMR